jgi:dihydroorotate dehydrogenase electron transfer subunit
LNTLKEKLTNLRKRVLNGDENVYLATVSGIATTQVKLIEYFDKHIEPIKIITTKSFQVVPNPGNREPIICEVEAGSFGNSVGLRNLGMEKALKQLKSLKDLRSILNVSISGSTIEDFITLVGAFEEVADIIELNFSCPHAASGYGSDIGSSSEIASSYMRAIRESYPNCKALIFPKLTPNVANIGHIAKELVASGADGLVAINTVGPEVHIEPISKQPILQNKLGGKGGKSGKWIFEKAITSIKAIREAVGDDVPIIGMGGITNATEIATMLNAGADVIGIGSSFGKVNQKYWFDYCEALVNDTTNLIQKGQDLKTASFYYDNKKSMTYQKRKIIKKEKVGEDIVILTLEGSWSFEAGEFVFLWLPQVGEKPFSIALTDPLTFIIKRKGQFTEVVYDLEVGSDLYIRGLYGSPVEIKPSKRALLIAGGTGVAVLPALAKRLKEKNTQIEAFIGVSEKGLTLFEDELKQYGNVTTISDDGVAARVLNFIDDVLKESTDLNCYLVGPTPFMKKGAQIIASSGVPNENILLSLELNTMCGIGMCGECLCGEKLTCAWGTFMSYSYIIQNEPELL